MDRKRLPVEKSEIRCQLIKTFALVVFHVGLFVLDMRILQPEARNRVQQ